MLGNAVKEMNVIREIKVYDGSDSDCIIWMERSVCVW